MNLQIAHTGHWLVNLLYLAPLIFVIAALGYQSPRDRRRGTGPRSKPGDAPPAV